MKILVCKRELEGGCKAKVSAAIPALVTCQLGLNTPSYPTLPNIMKAKKKELLTVEVTGLLKVESRQETVSQGSQGGIRRQPSGGRFGMGRS